ncbi:sensor histidine kinase [Paenibacillus gansuensis]|uniref:histidine kinase n=1 Tax=Paenibacillus gansuensis TaxID=306542 RepID=A0ABW5PIA1_9BACL
MALNMRLRSKLFVVYLLLSIIPLFVFVLYSYATIRSELTEQTYSAMSNTVSQIADNLQDKMDNWSKITASLYLDVNLQDYLTRDYSNSTNYLEAYEYINRVFGNIRTTNPDIHSIQVYIPNDKFPADGFYIRPIDGSVRQTGWFKQVSQTYGKAVYGTTIMDQDQNRVFTLARLLNINSLNYPYGILVFEMKEDEIYSLMSKESSNKEIMVTDADGVIVSASDKSLVSKRVDDLLPTKLPQQASGTFDTVYNGERSLAVYRTLTNGWHTLSIAPYSSFLAKADSATRNILWMALSITLSAVILLYFTSGLLTKRFEKLLNGIRKVGREDFDIRLGDMGNDEIGQVSGAFMKMSGKIDTLINEVYKKEIAKKETELHMLQSQINPHFLYNTLGSISALALKQGDNQVYAMVQHLAKFYRISLNKGKHRISIGEELELTRNYISIQQTRFKDLLHVTYDVDETLRECSTIKLILQPFVENSIHHGIWNDERGIGIVIRVHAAGMDRVVIDIIDDGMGMTKERQEMALRKTESGSGFGVRNVDERIRLAFGEEYGVQCYSRVGIGTQVRITLPRVY